VTVHSVGHALATGQTVTFANQSSAVGGLTLSGPYAISVSDADNYTVTAGSNASSTATGGGFIDYSASFRAGLVDATGEPGGYGTGDYGAGGYGGGFVATDILPLVWHLDNWGDNLLAVPRGGGLYEYQPSTDAFELVTNGTFASGAGWALGTGWTIGSGVATVAAGSASDLSRPIALVAGKTYRLSLTVARTAGTLVVKTDGGTMGEASSAISVSGTYTRTFVAPVGSTQLVLSKDAAFAGTVDNVSVSIATTAYRIAEAPSRNDAMFVDPNRIVVLIGTSLFGDVYNQMAVRWCDRENNRQWTPSTANLAGDYLLAIGGRAISGIATRQQNVVWTDAALYTMQFTGDPDTVFSFRLAGTGCGLSGALAKAEHNGAVFWKSRDNFFSFQGSIPQPIPCPVRRDILENMASGQDEKVSCGINTGFSEVWWLYPDARDGNECSRYVAFKWTQNDPSQGWIVGTMARSTWIKAGVFQHPILMGTDGVAYFHENGTTAGGAPIVSRLESSYFDVEDGNNLTILRRIVPDFEGQLGAVSFTIKLKGFPNGPERVLGTYTAATNVEKIDLRAMARQMSVTLSASSSPSFWRLGNFSVDTMKSGATR
jgi:hypothetical protein